MSSVFPTENQLLKQNKFKQFSTYYTWAGNLILTGEIHKTPSIQDATETETDVKNVKTRSICLWLPDRAGLKPAGLKPDRAGLKPAGLKPAAVIASAGGVARRRPELLKQQRVFFL